MLPRAPLSAVSTLLLLVGCAQPRVVEAVVTALPEADRGARVARPGARPAATATPTARPAATGELRLEVVLRDDRFKLLATAADVARLELALFATASRPAAPAGNAAVDRAGLRAGTPIAFRELRPGGYELHVVALDDAGERIGFAVATAEVEPGAVASVTVRLQLVPPRAATPRPTPPGASPALPGVGVLPATPVPPAGPAASPTPSPTPGVVVLPPPTPAPTATPEPAVSARPTAQPTVTPSPTPRATPTPVAPDLEALLTFGLARDLLGANQAQLLRQLVPALPGPRRDALDRLLTAARGDVERVFVLKSLAAGEPDELIAAYAAEIRGLDEAELIAGSTMRDDPDVVQQWEDACGPALLMCAAGEVDPRYAWELNKSYDLELVAPFGVNADVAGQQKAWLEEYGGLAVERGQTGGRGIGILYLLNDKLSPITRATYSVVPVDDKAAALVAIADHLARGYDVPLRVTWEPGDAGPAHFVLALAARGTPGALAIQIHDSFTGRTAWVAERDFLADALSPIFARYARLTHYYAPTPL